jgi:hypothetical protein
LFFIFIFIAHSVTGYQKTFLTFSNFYKCSMKVIIAQLCRQPPLHPIWQLIRGCQTCSPESDRTATPDAFGFFLPNLDNGNNNDSGDYGYERRGKDKRARAYVCHYNDDGAMEEPRRRASAVDDPRRRRRRLRVRTRWKNKRARTRTTTTTTAPRGDTSPMRRSIERVMGGGGSGSGLPQ